MLPAHRPLRRPRHAARSADAAGRQAGGAARRTTLVERVLAGLVEQGVADVVLNLTTGRRRSRARRRRRASRAARALFLGAAGARIGRRSAPGAAARSTSETFLIVNGDTLSTSRSAPMIDAHRESAPRSRWRSIAQSAPGSLQRHRPRRRGRVTGFAAERAGGRHAGTSSASRSADASVFAPLARRRRRETVGGIYRDARGGRGRRASAAGASRRRSSTSARRATTSRRPGSFAGSRRRSAVGRSGRRGRSVGARRRVRSSGRTRAVGAGADLEELHRDGGARVPSGLRARDVGDSPRRSAARAGDRGRDSRRRRPVSSSRRTSRVRARRSPLPSDGYPRSRTASIDAAWSCRSPATRPIAAISACCRRTASRSCWRSTRRRSTTPRCRS